MINAEQIKELNQTIDEITELYRQKVKYIVNQTPVSKDPV